MRDERLEQLSGLAAGDSMAADTRDDFSALAGVEHMLGIADPFAFMRSATEEALRSQVADVVLERIAIHGEPKFLSLGKKAAAAAGIVISHLGFCVRARLEVSRGRDAGREVLEAALTILLSDIDRPGRERCRTFCDLHDDAERTFIDDTFEARFLEFRREAPG